MGLYEEALQLIILLSTELPLPPLTSSERATMILRRELVHKLVSGPCTFSQLQECISIVPDHEKLDSNCVDEIAAEIGDRREGTGLEPAKLVLKEEIWREYDPVFWHLAPSAHQHAYEARPKLKAPMPYVCSPLPAHPSFLPLRAELLFDDFLLTTVRDLLYVYVSQRSRNPIYEYVRSNWGMRCSGTEYSRALQILTLAMHCALNEEMNRNINYRLKFESFLMKSTMIHIINSNMNESEDIDDIDTDDQIQIELPCFIVLLLEIYDTFLSNHDNNNKFWLKWLLDNARLLSTDINQLIGNKFDKESEESKLLEMERKRKMARDRAMQALNAVKLKAYNFLKEYQDEDDDESDDEGRTMAGAGSSGKAGTSLKMGDESKTEAMDGREDAASMVSIPLCIVCHESNDDDDLGFIGFSQVTTY